MYLVYKRQPLFVVEHIAKKIEVGDARRFIPDHPIDGRKPGFAGPAADGIVLLVWIIVKIGRAHV